MALCEGNQPLTIYSHHIGLVMGSFDILLLNYTTCGTKKVQLQVMCKLISTFWYQFLISTGDSSLIPISGDKFKAAA